MTVVTMSRKELTRLRVLIDVADGRLSVANAAGLMGVGRRQVYRLLDAFQTCGPEGLFRASAAVAATELWVRRSARPC
jgi:predicted DNA-binding transcriptional regulator YafY